MSEPADAPSVLLDLATGDELAARSLLPIEGITDGVLGFHAQQAVEKALKAVLAVNGVDFPYSYDLNGLIGLCRKVTSTSLKTWLGSVTYRCLPSGCDMTRVRLPTSTVAKPSRGQLPPSRGRGLS
jgi:HEPN domain-containing protein